MVSFIFHLIHTQDRPTYLFCDSAVKVLSEV